MALELKNYDPALAAGANVGVSVDLTDITDSNGNEVMEIDGVASAVNYVRVTNAATGSNVEFSAQGDDSNVGLKLWPKGTGTLQIITGSATTTTAITVTDADALTTGTIANFTSNSSSGSTRTLVKIVNDHSSATAATPLTLQQDAAGTILKLDGTLGTPTIGVDLAVIGSTNHVLKVPATSDTPVLGLTIGTAVASGAVKVNVLLAGVSTARYIFLYA